jgi:hypothetical protein
VRSDPSRPPPSEDRSRSSTLNGGRDRVRLRRPRWPHSDVRQRHAVLQERDPGLVALLPGVRGDRFGARVRPIGQRTLYTSHPRAGTAGQHRDHRPWWAGPSGDILPEGTGRSEWTAPDAARPVREADGLCEECSSGLSAAPPPPPPPPAPPSPTAPPARGGPPQGGDRPSRRRHPGEHLDDDHRPRSSRRRQARRQCSAAGPLSPPPAVGPQRSPRGIEP